MGFSMNILQSLQLAQHSKIWVNGFAPQIRQMFVQSGDFLQIQPMKYSHLIKLLSQNYYLQFWNIWNITHENKVRFSKSYKNDRISYL